MGEDASRIRQEIEASRARMGDTVEALSYKTDVKARARDSVVGKKRAVVGKITGLKEAVVGTGRDAAGNVKSTVEGAVGSARDTVAGAVDSAGEALPDAEDLSRQVRHTVSVAQENPLGLALGAAALGFLAGMMVPSTRMEDERMGDISDRVKDQVAETAHEAVDRGREVAQESVGTAVETARETGQEQAREFASSAQSRAQDTASQFHEG
ncbi:MAG: DUF3618 domain-containing protein [Candidatus Dormibacteria bacterium]